MSRILIAAHRGACGGNVPCNTTPAFECALAQKADIIELDVSRSKDGKLFVFHPKLEPVFLGTDRLIADTDSREVETWRFLNMDRAVT
ncbi:MAG: glycerophosphodiester phosphodiesterase, partial [Clostridia bacterium]|nr:glycerophosphodiester phosphodiesterase [Clostridia bacterium]